MSNPVTVQEAARMIELVAFADPAPAPLAGAVALLAAITALVGVVVLAFYVLLVRGGEDYR